MDLSEKIDIVNCHSEIEIRVDMLTRQYDQYNIPNFYRRMYVGIGIPGLIYNQRIEQLKSIIYYRILLEKHTINV